MENAEIDIVTTSITLQRVKQLAAQTYGDMVKAVADIEQKIIAIGGEYHADAEKLLLESGSKQSDLWGFNIYPEQDRQTWLEYNSLINIRPHAHNRSLVIGNQEIKEKIKNIVDEKIKEA